MGHFLKSKNMPLNKRKFTTASLEMAVNLAVIMALLSHFAVPLVVKADIDKGVADFSQSSVLGIATQGLIIKQGLTPLPVVKFSIRPINRETPDKVVKAVITAYTSTPDQTDDSPFIAASGKRVHDGMIAANFLPFGTKVKIPSVYGDKIFVVEDRMNSRYGYGRFDVWLDTTRTEARKFGVKRVEVEIFYPEKALSRAGK